jgi:hypothetical protein
LTKEKITELICEYLSSLGGKDFDDAKIERYRDKALHTSGAKAACPYCFSMDEKSPLQPLALDQNAYPNNVYYCPKCRNQCDLPGPSSLLLDALYHLANVQGYQPDIHDVIKDLKYKNWATGDVPELNITEKGRKWLAMVNYKPKVS